MKSIPGLAVVLLFVTLAAIAPLPGAAPAPAPPPKSAGGWTTGAVGTLGNVYYGPGEHWIDLATEGLYDSALWVVILDYATLRIAPGATVRFHNHPTRAPVVIRATGAITLLGSLNLDGAPGHDTDEHPEFSEPGPGGFRGGIRLLVDGESTGSGGHGPGGGFGSLGYTDNCVGGSGSHATPGYDDKTSTAPPGSTYGSPYSLPLLGGSGAGGSDAFCWGDQPVGGASGGGALLLGSDTAVHLGGTLSARGGYGPANAGSGGTIRIASPVITSQSGHLLNARGGSNNDTHGVGWIRVETVGDPGNINAQPQEVLAPLGEFLPANLPSVALVAWKDESGRWVDISLDPLAEISDAAQADVRLPATGMHMLRIEGRDVPVGSRLHIRTTYTRGQVAIDSTHTMGELMPESTDQVSWTDVTVNFRLGVSTVQVRAELP